MAKISENDPSFTGREIPNLDRICNKIFQTKYNYYLFCDLFFLEKGLGAMLRETFVIGAESELVMMRWAWRLLSVYPGLCIFRTQKKCTI